MAITAQLREAITAEVFAGLWPDEVPPFDAFAEFLGGLLAKHFLGDVANLRVELKRTDRWRIRVDGACDAAGGPMLFYAEVVWLPAGRMYRGTGAVRKAPEEPQPKTIDEFITAVEAISEDRDLIVSGQAYEAARGFHPQPGELRRALPAIFQLFERFPDEDFDTLVALVAAEGGCHDELTASLGRTPSAGALNLVNEIIGAAGADSAAEPWLPLVRPIAADSTQDPWVRDLAKTILTRIDHGPIP